MTTIEVMKNIALPILFVCFCCVTALAQKKMDLTITNVRIVDGSGNPWYYGAVGIRKGKIAQVGNVNTSKSKRVIDGGGAVIAPGFIDVHAHVEGSLLSRPLAENFLYDGVTSIVTGNCGSSATDMDAFFKQLEDQGIAINTASLIGHNSVRRKAMGLENRAPTPGELITMQNIVRQAMDDGAVGLSTGLIYLPGTFAETREIVALADVVAQRGGVYASHIRHEDHQVKAAILEAVEIGKQANLPVQISHFKISGKATWGASKETVAMVEDFRSEGIDVTVDQYPYTASSTSMSTMVPSWAQAGGNDSLLHRMSVPDLDKRIRTEMKEMLEETGFSDFHYAAIANCPWDSTYNGLRVPEVAKKRLGASSVDDQIQTILEMVSKGARIQMVYHKMGEEDVQHIMQYPYSMVARDAGIPNFGSGNPHPRAYGSCARVLGHYVREKQVLRLEDAVRKMSSLPAQRFGFNDRGMIRKGMVADLVVFDPQTIRSNATFEDSHHYSEGMQYVIVNGDIVIDAGKHNGTTPGKILRSN